MRTARTPDTSEFLAGHFQILARVYCLDQKRLTSRKICEKWGTHSSINTRLLMTRPLAAHQFFCTLSLRVSGVTNTGEKVSILSSRPLMELGMPRRRLEDRIQDLCRRATERNWPQILSELRRAIREHSLRVANRTAAAVIGGMPHIMRERRERKDVVSDWIPEEFRNSNERTVN